MSTPEEGNSLSIEDDSAAVNIRLTASYDDQREELKEKSREGNKERIGQFIEPIFDNMPGELKAQKMWVVWRGVPKQNRDGETRFTKPPLQPSGRPAESDNPDTWHTFSEVKAAYETGKFDGVGIMTVRPYVTYDQDHCIDERGKISRTATEDLDDLNTYSEISPSGTGIRAICKGEKPGTKCKRGNFELYDSARYVTLTGHLIEPYPANIRENNDGINAVYERRLNSQEEKGEREREEEKENRRITDNKVIAIASTAANGSKFTTLYNGGNQGYPSPSEADLAFCDILAYYTRDGPQIARIWKASGRYRDKLENKKYVSKTISKALERVKERRIAEEEERLKTENEERGIYYEDHNHRLKLDEPEIANRVIKETHLVKMVDQDFVYAVYDKGVYTIGQGATGIIRKKIQGIVEKAPIEKSIDLDKNLTSSVRRNIMGHVDGKAELMNTAEWNHDENMLVVANGAIHLPTGELFPWDPEMRATSKVDIRYNEKATCPVFQAWLEEMQPDPTVRRYLQKLAGSFLYRKVLERAFYIFLGKGNDGKSTFMGIMHMVIDNLMDTANKCLITQGDENEVLSEIAKIWDKNVVEIHELEKNETLVEGRTKELTGKDYVRGRRKHGQPFTYCPGYKLVLVTNHMPKSTSMSENLLERFRVVPWERSLPIEKQDPNFANRMIGELPGILNWMVQGAIIVDSEGMGLPEWNSEFMGSYQSDGDPLDGFCQACLENRWGEKEKAGDLYNVYLRYTKKRMRDHLSMTAWGNMMATKQYLKKKTNQGVVYLNVAIREEWEEDDDAANEMKLTGEREVNSSA